MEWRHVATAAVAGVLLLAGGKVAYSAHATAAKCQAISDRIAERGVMEPGSGPADVAVVGDSYAAGDGLADRSQSWAHLVGGRVSGIGGSGFVNGGPCGNQSFDSRLAAALSTSPRTVVLEGGLNDTDELEGLEDAVGAALERLSGVESVVVVGPPEVPTRDSEATVDAVLSRATARAGRTYISLLTVPIPLGPDRLHPTSEGQAAIAALVKRLEPAAPSEGDEVTR